MTLNFKKIFICIYMLMVSCAMISQSSKIDSLESILRKHKDRDTVCLDIMYRLVSYTQRQYPQKALEYANQIEILADEIQSIGGKARSFYAKGVIYTQQGHFEVAIDNYEKAIELFHLTGDSVRLSGCKQGLGVLYGYKGKPKLALNYHKEALAIDEKLGKEQYVPGHLLNIGNIYVDMGAYKKALPNFKKALDAYKKSNDLVGIINSLNSIAIVYYDQGNYPLSIEYYNKSLDIAQNAKDTIGMFQALINIGNIHRQEESPDKAIIFYNKAEKINTIEANIPILKNNIAGVYYDKEKFDIAILYFKESIEVCRRTDNDRYLAQALNGLGFAYFEIKKYNEALKCFEEANKINLLNNQFDLMYSYHGMADVYYALDKYDLALINAQKMAQLSDEDGFLMHKKNAYALLSKIYKKTGNYLEALESHEQYKILHDSIFNKENDEKIAQIEAEYKYKIALDSANIRELELKNNVETASKKLEKSQRSQLTAVIIILLLLIVLGTIIFLFRVRNLKAKAESIALEQKLLRSQMTPHFMFNSLSVLQGLILDKEEKKSIIYLSKFSKLLRIILENSRYKTVSLSSELEAIDNYISLQNIDMSPQLIYEYSIDSNIKETQTFIPPMLIQPFIENAVEHAFSEQKDNKKINLNITQKDKKIVCTILDNGKGININNNKQPKTNKSSLATTITSERLQAMSNEYESSGTIKIKNREEDGEKGTIVTLIIPYRNNLN